MFVIEEVPEGPRRSRLLLVLTVVGGVLAVALAIVGGVWLEHDLHAKTPVVRKYDALFAACVRAGHGQQVCSVKIVLQCRQDPTWHGNAHLAARGCRRWDVIS